VEGNLILSLDGNFLDEQMGRSPGRKPNGEFLWIDFGSRAELLGVVGAGLGLLVLNTLRDLKPEDFEKGPS